MTSVPDRIGYWTLVEVYPDLLKFDISLVRNINNALPKRRKMVRTLIEMVRDSGIS